MSFTCWIKDTVCLISTTVVRREILQETAPHLVSSICAYRAGYIAQVSIFVCHFLSTIMNDGVDELQCMK